MPPSVHLNVPEGRTVPGPLIERAAELLFAHEGVREGEISVTFLLDGPILELNRRWLGHDWVPDVLAFALHDPGDPPIGDVYIGVDQARRQAAENGVTPDEEWVRLTIHGVLHVLGYEHSDHLDGVAEGPFFTLQESILREAIDPGVSPPGEES